MIWKAVWKKSLWRRLFPIIIPAFGKTQIQFHNALHRKNQITMHTYVRDDINSKGLSHQWLENHRCGSLFLPFLSQNVHFIYSFSVKKQTLITLFHKKAYSLDSLLTNQNQAVCLRGNKCCPVLPAWILWWSLFMLYPIANKILWAVTFAFPRYKYRLNSISSLMFAKLPSAWILRFIRSCVP